MSNEIPLSVIYQKLANKEEKEEEKEVSIDVENSKSSYNEESECCKDKKKKRGKFCISLCALFGIFTFLMALVYIIITLAITMKFYSTMHKCFHSKEYFYKEHNVTDLNITRIHFEAVTGQVNIGFHSKKYIEVRLWDKFKSLNVIDPKSIESSIHVNGSIITISSESPAFNFKSCQHAKIDILIPNTYPQLITLTGVVKVGHVSIDGENGKSFKTVDVIVEAGYIEADQLLTNYLSLSTELGVIEVSDSIVPFDTKISTLFGSIRTYDLITKNIKATTQYGCSTHRDLVADNVNVNTKLGYSTILQTSSLGHEEDIDVFTEYGKTTVVIDNPKVNFTLGTKKGHMIIEFEDEEWKCKILNSVHHVSMSGKCDIKEGVKEGKTKEKSFVTKLNMHTKYGTSDLVVDHIDPDEM